MSSGDGTLELTPTATRGAFTANLANPLLGPPLDCTWHGAPGGGHQLGELQDGTPFAHAVSTQWPGYPGLWNQRLSSASTAECGPAFTDIPLQGGLDAGIGRRDGRRNHFIFAAVPRNQAVESQALGQLRGGLLRGGRGRRGRRRLRDRVQRDQGRGGDWAGGHGCAVAARTGRSPLGPRCTHVFGGV